MTSSKIRPPTHSSFKAQAEAELPDLDAMPDIGGRLVEAGSGHITEAVRTDVELPDELNPADIVGREGLSDQRLAELQASPLSARDTFTPEQAHRARLGHGEKNRLGLPADPNASEVLLAEYQAARTAWKAAYSGTRQADAEEARFITAKQAMMAAGLLPQDS